MESVLLARQLGYGKAAQRRLDAVDLQLAAGDRLGLLGVNGIGPETADDILLYALEQPVFVIDAYTRRLLHRLGWTQGGETYEDLRAGFERALSGGVYQYQQFHALIVMHAKEACRKVPRCAQCALAPDCPAAP